MTDSPASNLFHQSSAARQRGDRKASMRLIQACIRTDPSLPGPWYNLASDLADRGDRIAAVAALRRVLETKPDEPYTLNNLGWNLQILGRYGEAFEALTRAAEVAPDLPLVWSNLSLTHASLRHRFEAIDCARKAVALAPDDSQHHMALAFALMLDGKWSEGMREYGWRFQYKSPEYLRYPMPLWDGEPVETLFIPAEQGFGDSIQFSRFIPFAVKRAKRVVVGVQETLADLFRATFPEVEVLAMPTPIPPADAFCPMLSLPVALAFNDVTLANTPPAPIAAVTPRPVDARKRVAIVWAGSPEQENDHNRSSTVEDFLTLYETPGLQLYSVQVGDRARDCRKYDPLIIDLSHRLRDFSDTAALLGTMDAVVTVCTAVAHLAGSIGVPTHVALPRHGPHFVWGYPQPEMTTTGETTPWYPSMRLYRQDKPGDWRTVLKRIARKI